MERVTHHGRETAYRRVDRGGEGGLLCVHGSGATHEVWRAQFRLADRRPVVALDLSGHGDSEDVDAPPGEATLAAYAEDVLAVARETGADVLAGNSLGGAVVLRVALDSGFDPAGLVLAGTGARLSVLPELLSWLRADFERAVEFLHADDRLFHDADERRRAASKAAMREAGPAVTYRDFETCDGFDVRDRLGEIGTPSLALTGAHDELTPPWYHEYLAENMPNATRETVDGAAHLSMLERPDAFNRAVEGFLADLA